MKIFTASADQIERLDEHQLVDLLRRLVRAELEKHRIPLSSGTVPEQIHIPDGGEDGRVSWTGAPHETDYLPSRLTVFQCKKTAPKPAALRQETWKKSTGKDDHPPELSDALTEALSQSGAYVVVTASPVVGTKIDRRIDAIQNGIRETGHEPTKLSAIRIYDSNHLANWATSHPRVALWLNATLRDVHLHGFRTFDDWLTDPTIAEIPLQTSNQPRYRLRGHGLEKLQEHYPHVQQDNELPSIKRNVAAFFAGYGHALRLIGPSGYGKTRFANALFLDHQEDGKYVLAPDHVIYAVYEDVKNTIVNVTREITQSGSRAIIIVDDCPEEVHQRLADIVNSSYSNCHVITIGVETKSQGANQNLVIELRPAPDDLIDAITSNVSSHLAEKQASFIRELAQGYPRMAILAARAALEGDEHLSSVDRLVSRIVWGDRTFDQDAFESLQLLSLFTVVGVENAPHQELVEIGNFDGRTATQIYKHITQFNERGIITKLGDFVEIQPIPLAVRLINQWLESHASGTIHQLFFSLSPKMQLRMIRRLRWLSWSQEVNELSRAVLLQKLPDEAALDSEFSSQLLDRLVHLNPDQTMTHLSSILGSKTIGELQKFEAGRRHTVCALEKLVFRTESFEPAADLLLKLGAAETENCGNNATGQFVTLYQLRLSGTEAGPAAKLRVLDRGLASDDERIRVICVQALDRMLTTGHFLRTGGMEKIGSGTVLSDWSPTTYGEIFDYYRAALGSVGDRGFPWRW